VIADVYIFGGAAMALAYDARRATRDIDAVFHPHGVVQAEASRSRGARTADVVAQRTGDEGPGGTTS